MRFKADEISSVLQSEIEQYRSKLEVHEVGRVLPHSIRRHRIDALDELGGFHQPVKQQKLARHTQAQRQKVLPVVK